MEITFREKQETCQMAMDLRNWLKPEALEISADIEKYPNSVLDIYEVYVEIFDTQIRAAAWIRKTEQSYSAEDQRNAGETLAKYNGLTDRPVAVALDKGYPSSMEYTMNSERTKWSKENCSGTLDGLGG